MSSQPWIIRRIIDSIRNAQISMLLLELTVVALGLFLGFQVDRWYEATQNAARAAQYAERLKLNLAEDMRTLDGSVRLARSRLLSTERLIESVKDPELATEDPTQYLIDLEQSLYRFGLVPNDATYTELLSTGELNLLDVELRDALFRYYSQVRNRSQFDDYIRAIQEESLRRFAGVVTADQFDHMLMRAQRRAVPYTATEALQAAERLRSRQEATDWLPRLKQVHLMEESTYENLLNAATELNEVLDQHN